MDFKKLFSFEGRVGRGTWWGISLANIIVLFVASSIIEGVGNAFLTLVAFVVVVASMWAGLATSVKRWHDRDKSWAWIFISAIPIVGGIWAFVEQGCLAGTDGDNQYGSPESGSPFAPDDTTAFPTPGREWGR